MKKIKPQALPKPALVPESTFAKTKEFYEMAVIQRAQSQRDLNVKEILSLAGTPASSGDFSFKPSNETPAAKNNNWFNKPQKQERVNGKIDDQSAFSYSD